MIFKIARYKKITIIRHLNMYNLHMELKLLYSYLYANLQSKYFLITQMS